MDTPTVQPTNPPVTQPVPPPSPKNNSGILIGIFLLLLGIVVGLLLDKTTLLSTLRIPYFGVTPTPTLIPTPTPTPDPTANWKIFQSEKFSYQIKYPPEMKPGERPPGAPDYYDDVSFSLIKDTGKNNEMVDGLSINIRKQDNSQKLPLKEWLNNQDRGVSVINDVIDFSIAGLNAIRVFGQGLYPFDEIVIPQDNRVLIIQGTYIGKDKEKYKETFDQILSTFKFTEEKQTKINCKDPRPEVCTMECIQNPPYICGSDGKSYCTICQACADKDVAWYETKASACGE